jgi:hypothetical protein
MSQAYSVPIEWDIEPIVRSLKKVLQMSEDKEGDK